MKKEPTIQERNEAIARFLNYKEAFAHVEDQFGYIQTVDGFKIPGHGIPCPLTELMFHSDWNWLMSVVEKIERAKGICTEIKTMETVGGEKAYKLILRDIKMYGSNCIGLGESNSKIEAVFLAVSDFCIQYNDKKQS